MTTILILDDNPVVLQMLGLVLRSKGGYEILEAATEQEAAAQIERHSGQIDLLIADVCVDDRPGRAVVDRLLAVCPGLRVLFISGYPKDHLVDHGWLESADAFLAKPFRPELLLRTVNDLLANSCPTHVLSATMRTASAGGAR